MFQGNVTGSNLPPSSPSDPWHLGYTELRAMGQQMSKLDNIERDVASLKFQFEEISGKTKALEVIIQSHSTDMDTMRTSISEIKSDVQQQDTALGDFCE